MKKIAFATLGCRFNQVETAEMTELFKENSYNIVPFNSEANIYVINTCTVTGKSDQKSLRLIRKVREQRKNAKIVVTGCLPETGIEKVRSIPGIDLVIGNREKYDVVKHVDSLKNQNSNEGIAEQTPKITINQEKKKNKFKSRPVMTFNGRTSAYLKVQTGCNMNCSYCIVTKARGESLSESVDKIISNAKRVIESGYNEIVLTGINLGCYGHDLSPKIELSDLLISILKIKWNGRIRLSSINPNEITPKLIETIKNSSRVCRHLHIPIQSGDNTILSNMRRNYNSNFIKNLILNLNNSIPGISIGTDILVGFPGETEEQFINTYNLIKELPFSYLHVFNYSPREGTDASLYTNQLSKKIKEDRSLKMITLGKKKKNIFMNRFIGTTIKVLVKNTRDKKTGLLAGLSDNFLSINLNGPDNLKNKFVSTHIQHIDNGVLTGETVTNFLS